MTLVGWVDIVLTGVLLSGLTSAVMLVAGGFWRNRVLARQADPFAVAQAPRFALGRTPFSGQMLNVATEVRTVLGQLAPLAAQGFVRLELAVPPELEVRADARALREVLGDLVSNAIRHTPCGHVLVGAMRHGGRVQISVTDDGAGPPEATQAARLRDAERLVALQGGTIDVDVHAPGEGATVRLRFPEPRGATAAAMPTMVAGDAPAATNTGRPRFIAARAEW